MSDDPSTLSSAECYWRDRQPWLEECGYMLHAQRGHVLDAARSSDGKYIFLSSEPLASDPRNHCVPLLDVLRDPEDGDICLLVMSMLRRCNNAPFVTVGEAIEFFQQAFEGLLFIHEHNVAHRDTMLLNIMLDPTPMFHNMYHFASTKYYARTERPPKYFWTDFGLSQRYNPETSSSRELPILGGDKSAPEHQGVSYNVPCDPMPTDVYYLGNLIRENFLQNLKYANMRFMQPLVDDMVCNNPAERPTMDEIRKKLHWWNLRARRLVRRSEWCIVRPVLGTIHVFRTARYIAKRLPAVPTPSA
ncbi:hypothetical protein DAEQUDRAFT_742671 [Daedalea quercina L-15889]|uniref:Protein kinase domain-containing protein n=1 Tax=Daedalea quercina L-15889 TaxID=1314783 RepID=A0A165U8C8_9APHY|nr:hypothetical protein DAEQUDRAFT_742671 [Daedalea quercina L-15889]